MSTEKKTGEVIKTRYSSKDLSLFNPNYTLGEVVEGKIKYLLEKVNGAPHIVAITKQQICMSEKPFMELPKDDYRRVPLVGFWNTETKHLSGRRPSVREQRQQVSLYGFAMRWPHESIMAIIQSKYKSIVDDFRKDKSSILPVPFRNYLDDKGNTKSPEWNTTEPLHHSYYAGYLMVNTDYRDYINEYLKSDDAPKWLKWQFVESIAYSRYALNKRIERLNEDSKKTELDLIAINEKLGDVRTSLTEDEVKLVTEKYE